MDEAQKNAYVIKKQLSFLKKELDDLKAIYDNFNYNKDHYFGFNVNYYSHLITDWVNDKNLINALTSTMDAHLNIIKLKKNISSIITKTETRINRLNEKRNDLIIGFNS